MEVVVLCVAKGNQGSDNMDKGCVEWSAFRPSRVDRPVSSIYGVRTHSGSVLAEVSLLVAAEEALGLLLGGSASRQLLVEAHDLLHADSIRG